MRRLILWSLLLVFATGCSGEEKNDQPDVEDMVEEADTAPANSQVSLSVSGNLTDAIQTHESGGVDFNIETRAVYLIVGNFSVLETGEPVPSYTPDTDPPLEAGLHSLDGYTAVELIEGGDLGSVEVPAGRVGPAYLGIFEGDRVAPVSDADGLPLDDAILYVDAQITVGDTFVKDVEFTMPGGRVLIAGAPAFDASADLAVTVSIDLDGWFDGIDVDGLTHTNNIVTINPDLNTDAYDVVSANANAALDNAEVVIQ